LESIARYAPAAHPPATGPAPIPDDRPLELSHGQIDDYLTCPLKYRYAHVMQVPLGSDPQVMYGIAVHHALRVFHQHRMRRLPIDADDVLAAFEGAWSSEGFYSREHEELRLQAGRDALRRFVEREVASGAVPLATEADFRFRVGPDLVVGRWDRIDEVQGGIVLVDYKTSEVEDAGKAAERARRSLKDEQLGLYALGYAETRGAVPKLVRLHFIGTGVTGEAEVEPEHLESARERVLRAAAGIRAARFEPRPDPNHCRYCPYARFCPHRAGGGAG
jgi:DNA helicase-2/ATP-dependent DNA helicase PcrA